MRDWKQVAFIAAIALCYGTIAVAVVYLIFK